MVEPENSSRMEKRKVETRKRIIQAALELFAQNGIDSVTMEQIADRADVARGTLYNHFPVKEAVIAEHIENLSMEINSGRIERLKAIPDTRSRLELSLHELMKAVKTQPDLFEKYFTYRTRQMVSLMPDESNEKGLRFLEKAIIQMGQESGELRSDFPPSILEALFSFVFIETAQQYYRSPDDFDEDEAISTCVDLFLDGVASN